MRDRRREERNRRVPTKPLRQRQVGEPKHENLGVDERRVVKTFHRRGAGVCRRRERMFGAGYEVPQGVDEPLEARAVRKVENIGCGS